MLRRMSLPRQVVSRTLTLSCALIGAAATLACQQVKDLVGGKTDEKTDAPATTATPPADGKTDVVAVTPPPTTAMPLPMATLDSLLALVHADGTGPYAIVRQPTALLDLGDEAIKFYDGPVQTLVTLLGTPEIASGFAVAKTGLGEFRSKLAASGVDLGRGVVFTQTGAGSSTSVLLVSAAQADSVKGLMTALGLPGADKTVCKAIDAAPGFVGCADAEATLAAYKPGDAARRRQAAEAGLPGVKLDDLSVLGFSPDDGGVHVAMAMPAGLGVVHVGLPAGGNDVKDAMAVLEPGPATTLRFAAPGTGFVWARADMAELKRRTPDLGSAPPPFDAIVNQWNGEMFFGGSSDPAAMQVRLGLGDAKPAAAALATAAKQFGPMVPKSIPGLPASKVTFESVDVTFGAELTRAIHVAVGGLDQASIVTQLLGLTPDAWLFAVDGSLAFAVGADSKSVARMVGAASADATIATLPPAVAEDLRANKASFVMHMPLDALQGPTLRKALESALKNVPNFKPEQARSTLAMLSPLSSGTLWITEDKGVGVVHMAIQGIGHTSDEEGKAALAAAVAVAGGGDPATLFGELVTKFPNSPRLSAYQTRAGSNGAGVLTGSAVGGMALSGAIAWTYFLGVANKALAAEIGVPTTPPPVVEPPKPVDTKKPEEKKPEEKKPEEKKPETTKPPQGKPAELKLPPKRVGREDAKK